jgi:hypothetical protein
VTDVLPPLKKDVTMKFGWMGVFWVLAAGAAAFSQVTESARDIPVAYDVDVVVVGGSSGGVAAAVEAAQSGASVFLLSSRPYLGTDLCGTGRLWLEPGEVPQTELGRALFPLSAAEQAASVPFTYQADRPSAAPHRDRGNKLTDGRFADARKESVQYNGDVTLTLDLKKTRPVGGVSLMAFQRPGEFAVDRVAVFVSTDLVRWTPAGEIKNETGDQGFETEPLVLSVPLDQPVRGIRLDVSQRADAERLLLGEVVVEPAGAEKPVADPAPVKSITPFHAKQTFSRALVDNGVSFLLGCYATDVLLDPAGKPAGIVMANRAGRQAVRAKVIIDATSRATVARLLGAEFLPVPAGPQEFQRIVIGGEPVSGPGLKSRRLLPDVEGRQVTEYTLSLPVNGSDYEAFARAEQTARDMTWQAGQIGGSDFLFQVPPDPMKSVRGEVSRWPGAAAVDLDAFRPAGVERLFVLGGCAGLSRDAAAKLLRPFELMQTGARIGAAAARRAAGLPAPERPAVAGEKKPAVECTGDIREPLRGPRDSAVGVKGIVRSPERSIPVLGQFDVVVIGGGTGGAPAGIGAARRGARTLVVEYLNGLGGVSTIGMIGHYWYGNQVGFTSEIDQGCRSLTGGNKTSWTEARKEWYRSELRRDGAEVWFGCMGNGAFVEDGVVKGVVVVTPFGRGVVLCQTVIDSTGNADIAAAAGAECSFAGGDQLAFQGTGLSSSAPGQRYKNSDWDYVRDSDVVDRTRMHTLGALKKYSGVYDISPLIGSRERRRIVGDYTLTPLDIILGHTFSDTIVKGTSNLDSHGYTVHPVFRFFFPPRKQLLEAYVPYRCLLPKGLDGILVASIGASYQRDAMPIVRMQPDVQNQGYAAGVAAAMAASENVPARQIDIRKLQRHLVSAGNLEDQVLSHDDWQQPGVERVQDALMKLESGRDFATILTLPADQSVPLVEQAWESAADPDKKLRCAHLLAVLGSPAGRETLHGELKSRAWDKGWTFVGMGNHGSGVSEMDSMVMALGQLRDDGAVALIVEKLSALTPQSDFSHIRACSLALGMLGDPQAAPALAALLRRPGMSGHAALLVGESIQQTPAGKDKDSGVRERSLRELLLAEALYRCGDDNGLGESILKQYVQDLRGVYSRYAQAVLE